MEMNILEIFLGFSKLEYSDIVLSFPLISVETNKTKKKTYFTINDMALTWFKEVPKIDYWRQNDVQYADLQSLVLMCFGLQEWVLYSEPHAGPEKGIVQKL